METTDVVWKRIIDSLCKKFQTQRVTRDVIIDRINKYSFAINSFLVSRKQLRLANFGTFKHTKGSKTSLRNTAIAKRTIENRYVRNKKKESKRIKLQQARSAKGLSPIVKWV